MGCCGCNKQNTALTAGIFGLIQSLIGVISYSYFWNLYSKPLVDIWDRTDESIYLLYETRNVADGLRVILGLVTFSHATWLISSIILLVGTCTDSACCTGQWSIITTFIIIGDIVLPVVVISVTISEYSEVANSFSELIKSSEVTSSSLSGEFYRAEEALKRLDKEIDQLGAKASVDVHKYYILLILSFTKGLLITIITNIYLAIFTNRRAKELLNLRPANVLMAIPVVMVPQRPTGFPLNQQIQFISSNDFPGNQMQQYSNAQPPVGVNSPPSGLVNSQFRIEAQPQLDEPEEAEPKNENQTIGRARVD